MSGILLSSCANFPIIKQVAWILGHVINFIYNIFDTLGIANIGLCIIIFTLIVKLLMIPMTVKQQKFSKVSTLMNPEIQAIQKKYAGKRDNESMLAMQEETKALYEKYGTSPSGGCSQLLIQFPILLALYAVISSIPTYVTDVEGMYKEAATTVYESMDEYSEIENLNNLLIKNKVDGFKKDATYNNIVETYSDLEAFSNKSGDITIYEFLSNNYSRTPNNNYNGTGNPWSDWNKMYEGTEKIISSIEKISDKDWTDFTDKLEVKDKEIAEDVKANIAKYRESLDESNKKLNKDHEKISDVYSFAGIDLSRSPSEDMSKGIWWALLIPILSALTQWYSTKMTSNSQPSMDGNPMASSMKVMMITMPLFSAFMCYTLPSGLGLYWVINAAVQIIIQFFMNKKFASMDVNDIIKANVKKANKKRAKMGLPPQAITNAANTNAKNIKSNENSTNKNSETGKQENKTVTYKKGGIAAKAHMVKDYNERNNK